MKNKKSVTVQCQFCKKEFKAYQSHINRGAGKYCSRHCSSQSQRKQKISDCKCVNCGVEFYKKNPGHKGEFCSFKCLTDYKYRPTIIDFDKIDFQNTKANGRILIRKKCIHCGEDFVVNPSKSKTAKFCSQKCKQMSERKTRIQKQCTFCNKSFYIHECQDNVGRGKFCSRSCSVKYTWKTQYDEMIKTIMKASSCVRFSNTNIEKIVEQELQLIKCSFISQKWIYGKNYYTCPDFFIYPNICLYVDGEYWHNKPKIARRDIWINNNLEKDNFKVIRISENAIWNCSFKSILQSIKKEYDEYVYTMSC